MTPCAALLFSTRDAGVKWLSGEHHVLLLLFVRSAVVAAVFLLLAARTRRAPLAVPWRGPSPGLPWLRSLPGCLARGVYFHALQRVPLGVLQTLMFTMPLFVALLAGPLPGERLGVLRVALVLLGFAGVLVVVRPGSGLFAAAALPGLLAALCHAAMMMIVTRALGATVDSATMALTVTLVFALALPWTWRTPRATSP